MAESNRFDVSFLGSADLERKFALLPRDVERRLLSKSLRKAAKVYKDLAAARAPRDRGKLAKTMRIRVLKRRKGRVGVRIETAPRAQLGIDPKQQGYYPAHLEFGYRDRAGVHHPGLAYMRTSLRTGKEQMLVVLREELTNWIETVTRGIP